MKFPIKLKTLLKRAKDFELSYQIGLVAIIRVGDREALVQNEPRFDEALEIGKALSERYCDESLRDCMLIALEPFIDEIINAKPIEFDLNFEKILTD